MKSADHFSWKESSESKSYSPQHLFNNRYASQSREKVITYLGEQNNAAEIVQFLLETYPKIQEHFLKNNPSLEIIATVRGEKYLCLLVPRRMDVYLFNKFNLEYWINAKKEHTFESIIVMLNAV